MRSEYQARRISDSNVDGNRQSDRFLGGGLEDGAGLCCVHAVALVRGGAEVVVVGGGGGGVLGGG